LIRVIRAREDRQVDPRHPRPVRTGKSIRVHPRPVKTGKLIRVIRIP
jgi:hypothetical protein